MKIFVINLDRATDRWSYFKDDERFIRWSATDCNDLNDNHPIFKDMVSYWNISPQEHKAKCGCYLSHTNLWRYIVQNKLNDILILEDDAELVGEIPDSSKLPQDGFTYLGGLIFNKKITQGPKKVELNEGINHVNNEDFRMIMLVSYYIPHYSIAEKMLKATTERGRPRAIDTMVYKTETNQYLYYPAPFIERNIPSQIRKKKSKHSNEFYEWV